MKRTRDANGTLLKAPVTPGILARVVFVLCLFGCSLGSTSRNWSFDFGWPAVTYYMVMVIAGAFTGILVVVQDRLAGMVGGAIAGGLLFLHARSYAPALPLVITVLVILAGRTMLRAPRRQAH